MTVCKVLNLPHHALLNIPSQAYLMDIPHHPALLYFPAIIPHSFLTPPSYIYPTALPMMIYWIPHATMTYSAPRPFPDKISSLTFVLERFCCSRNRFLPRQNLSDLCCHFLDEFSELRMALERN
jgi:hypothetical protein